MLRVIMLTAALTSAATASTMMSSVAYCDGNGGIVQGEWSCSAGTASTAGSFNIIYGPELPVVVYYGAWLAAVGYGVLMGEYPDYYYRQAWSSVSFSSSLTLTTVATGRIRPGRVTRAVRGTEGAYSVTDNLGCDTTVCDVILGMPFELNISVSGSGAGHQGYGFQGQPWVDVFANYLFQELDGRVVEMTDYRPRVPTSIPEPGTLMTLLSGAFILAGTTVFRKARSR